ncbi:hypothetical protein E8D34_17170 [Nocardioides sp. GY 10113]|uniref:hypothetical protein n=1 Tax=Nocardioides sp. GY 10113 TaxID=2569761 RepID=UPI0010A89E03|nr:hypothetical protein [Nocardioides sp. GY 10113]TIC82213.1 hypothetical protein E8D34_17170 [Nocardioides sp. GY 10113]
MSNAAPSVTDYRLAPPVMARFVGAYLVVFAVVVLVFTVAAAGLGIDPNAIVVLLLLGLVGLGILGWWLRSRLAVVRLTATGYRVRLVRGVGVREARWSEVEDAVAAAPRDIECVVLRLKQGGTTTIPVQLLAADKDDFARDVRAHLIAAGR